MKDVMLDLETLGTRHDAAIISIGAVYFDRMTGQTGEEFSINVKYENGDDRFTTDYDTIKWWFEQSPEARRRVMEDGVPLDEALIQLNSFLWRSDIRLWSHATFDMPILMNAFDVVDRKFSVPYRNTRDLRTLMDISEYQHPAERMGTHHCAIDDATFQAAYASGAFRKLNGKD